MILIADGGSTKADWIALDTNKNELFRVRTLGLNPAVISSEELTNRIVNMFQLINVKDEVSQVYFYGAGCGTPNACAVLKDVMQAIFTNADIAVEEDMLAAVYAASGKKPALVCILGTGSNCSYYNGESVEQRIISLGYSVMDDASGNYYGRQLLRDYYFDHMPHDLKLVFKTRYDVNDDVIKSNLYKKANQNAYLATLSLIHI